MSRGTAEQVMGQCEKLQRQKQNVSALRYSLCGKKRRKCRPLRKVAFSVSRRKSWQKTSSTCIRCGASRGKKHTSTYVNVCLQKLRATAQSASAYVSIGAGKSSISRMWCSHGVHISEQTVENYWTQVTTIVATHGWPTPHNFWKFEGPGLNCRGRTPPMVVCV